MALRAKGIDPDVLGQPRVEVRRPPQRSSIFTREVNFGLLFSSHIRYGLPGCSPPRELLAPVYGWLTEGFDKRDLEEAKTPLGELTA